MSSNNSDRQDVQEKEDFKMFKKRHDSSQRKFSTARMTLKSYSESDSDDSDSYSSGSIIPPRHESSSNERSHEFSDQESNEGSISEFINKPQIFVILIAKYSQIQDLKIIIPKKKRVFGMGIFPRTSILIDQSAQQNQLRQQRKQVLDENQYKNVLKDSDSENESEGSVLLIDSDVYRDEQDGKHDIQEENSEVILTDKKVKKFKTQSERLKMDVVYKFLFRKIKKVILKAFYDSCKQNQSSSLKSSRKLKQNIRNERTTKLKEQMIKFLEQSWIQEPTKDVLCCLGLILYPNFNKKNFKFLSEAGLYPGMELKEEVCIAYSKIYRENNKKIRDTLFNHKFFREFVWPLFIKEVPSFDDVINAGEYKKYRNSVDHMFYSLDRVYDLVFPFKPNFSKEVVGMELKQDNPEQGQIIMEN